MAEAPINRRFAPSGRDRPLVELALAGCDRDVWKPILLFHMTRDEFLVRDFLIRWLYLQFAQGAYRLQTDDVTNYLTSLGKKKGVEWSGSPFRFVGRGIEVAPVLGVDVPSSSAPPSLFEEQF